MKVACILLVALTSVLFISGCIQVNTDQISGSGALVNETRNVTTFTGVTFAVPGTLHVTQSDNQSVKVEAKSTVISRVRTEVSNGGLTIDSPNTIVVTEPISVYVSLPEINGINNDGVGTVISDSELTANELSLGLQGAGSFNLDLNVTQLTTRISGVGSATLRGTAVNHTAILTGVGSLQSYDLKTETTSITIEGVGSAEVTATKNLDVNISGTGSVRYHGSPEVHEQRTGLGSLQKTG